MASFFVDSITMIGERKRINPDEPVYFITSMGSWHKAEPKAHTATTTIFKVTESQSQFHTGATIVAHDEFPTHEHDNESNPGPTIRLIQPDPHMDQTPAETIDVFLTDL